MDLELKLKKEALENKVKLKFPNADKAILPVEIPDRTPVRAHYFFYNSGTVADTLVGLSGTPAKCMLKHLPVASHAGLLIEYDDHPALVWETRAARGDTRGWHSTLLMEYIDKVCRSTRAWYRYRPLPLTQDELSELDGWCDYYSHWETGWGSYPDDTFWDFQKFMYCKETGEPERFSPTSSEAVACIVNKKSKGLGKIEVFNWSEVPIPKGHYSLVTPHQLQYMPIKRCV